MVKESAGALPLLGTCSKLKDSHFDCIVLTWLRYPRILSSLASNSPFTCPTISLKSEKSFMDFPPILWTIAIPSNRASYSAPLFIAGKSNLKDFSTITFSEDVSTNPTPEPFWFDAPSTCTSYVGGQYWEIVSTNFSSLFLSASNSFTSGLVNSATKSARTCPFTEVRGMYLISKARKIVPHLAIIPV